MKYRVYLDELEEESNEIINYSKNDINDKIDELSELVDEIKWKGKAHDTYIEGYKARIEKIRRLNNKIRIFGEYLKFCNEHYGETNEKLNKMWTEYLEELRKKNELFNE